jgi:2-iminoacetate synthase
MSFQNIFEQFSWEEIKSGIYSKTPEDVEHALRKNEGRNLEDFKALLSPAADYYLEEMAGLSHRLSISRFGNTIQMFAPVYLSNECQNICTYCGFSYTNKISRITLSEEQIEKEYEAIKAMGFEHILIVTGEANHTVDTDYFIRAIQIAKKHFSYISIEVQPLEQADYERLVSAGLHAVLVYQETYHKESYTEYHPKGKKSNFNYRLETPDRIGKAGLHKIGLGCLIGLDDWRADSFFTAVHLQYLEKKYWKTKYSISFPRLRPASGVVEPKVVMSDRELVQLICAWRIFNSEVELSLSTRENKKLRDHLFRLGITTTSAGSKTNPGGYADKNESLEQFEISDERSAHEIADVINNQGYEVVWKDWDQSLTN